MRETSSVMGAQEQRLATGPWVPFPRVLGSHRGVREGQWPERRCTFWGYLGVAMSRGSDSLVWVTPEVTSHPPLPCCLNQIRILRAPLLISWPLDKSFYQRPSPVSSVTRG